MPPRPWDIAGHGTVHTAWFTSRKKNVGILAREKNRILPATINYVLAHVALGLRGKLLCGKVIFCKLLVLCELFLKLRFSMNEVLVQTHEHALDIICISFCLRMP